MDNRSLCKPLGAGVCCIRTIFRASVLALFSTVMAWSDVQAWIPLQFHMF